uniref:Uncharacterized protein LOC104243079 n=1 Tax=Nicotiana sylvestris TaxID=4096 RepID=A0A1U7YCK1_NICSY
MACLRYLSSKANVNFTFSHLIHLYHPNLIRHGVFTLTTRSKKVLVNPEDDKDRGWYIRYVAVRFDIRGMTAEVAMAIRMSANAALDLDKARALLPKRKATKESSEKEEDAVSVSLPALTTSVCLPISSAPISVPLAASSATASAPVLVSTSFPSIPSIPSTAPLPSVHHTESGSSSGNMTMRSVTLEVPTNHSLLRKTGRADPNLIGTELMRRISLLERKARESEKSVHEAEEIARGAQLEATNWKEQFENAQGNIEELQEDKNLLEQQNRGLTSELATVKASSSQLTQAQADLQTSSDEIQALKSSHASLEASLDSHLAENQILKNDLAMWEKEYGLLEENFNIEVSWAFLNSRRDALTEAAQEGFDLQSELAKVIDTIEKSQQSTDTPSPALEVPENVAIPASEGETSTT